MENKELSQIEKVENTLKLMKNEGSRFLFFVANSKNPAGSIYEIYQHATVVKNMGYNVTMVVDDPEFTVPTWIEKELTEFEHTSMENIKITVGSQDVLVIPEIFTNVMEQTANLPCIRITFLQSVDYMLNSLIPGVEWKDFGIENVITTSETLKNIVHEFFGMNKYKVDVYTPGIPDYFKNDNPKTKRPVISIVGRNPNEIAKVVKLFYLKFPQFSWVTFDSMLTESKPPQPLTRKDFANKLSNNFAAVWIDRISSFGTFPLECMKCGTIPIAIKPDITPEYILEKDGVDENGKNIYKYIVNSGVWTDDIYALPELIGNTISKFLDDTIGDDITKTMGEIASKYSVEKSKEDIEGIYSNIINKKILFFENALKTMKAEENNNKEENK